MTTTAPTLPPTVVAAIRPAVDAIQAEVRDAVLSTERIRLRRQGLAAVRASGPDYRPGVDAILRDAVGTTTLADDAPPSQQQDGRCRCPHCGERETCPGDCFRCEDTSCQQCHPEGCYCEDCDDSHPEGCYCEDCDPYHPDRCRCDDCGNDHPDRCRCDGCI